MSQREQGYAVVMLMDSEGEWRLPIEDFERLRSAWTGGASFIELVDVYGSTLVLKGSRIEAITRVTPATLAAQKAYEDAERVDNAINGDA